MAKKETNKGILGKAVDALTGRDKKEAAAEEELKEATAREEARAAGAAEHKATLERAHREAAEAATRATEKKLEEAEAKLEEAQKEAAREKAKAAREERERQRKARAEERRAEAEATAEEARTYVVKSGDSLSKIAKELLGDASRWPEIFEANKDKIKDPNLIHPGQELNIPG